MLFPLESFFSNWYLFFFSETSVYGIQQLFYKEKELAWVQI